VVAVDKEGHELTLKRMLDDAGIDPSRLNVDTLDVMAEANIFDRFDRFNAKYNPFGNSQLRTVFLKTSNYMKGQYFAELTQSLFTTLEDGGRCAAEYRASVYGVKRGEWDGLAEWMVGHKLYSDRNRWLVQCPRIFPIFKKIGAVKTFQDLLSNIFIPLFEVSIDPASHPTLHTFLKQVVGFDSVDDESKVDGPLIDVKPEDWDTMDNPPYSYYSYFMWANIYAVNQIRAAKGLNTFTFRPHCGESGSTDHLAAAFLTADGINHGIALEQVPVLQYLYYLCQIGIAVSPLSNNCLFLPFSKSPFPELFRMGLNVSLTTDDPLQFHLTKESLMEEYAIAKKAMDFTVTDLCEIARNSVLQSGFEHEVKTAWLGEGYWLPGAAGNNPAKTNIPQSRRCFRYETLVDELNFLSFLSGKHVKIPNVVLESVPPSEFEIKRRADMVSVKSCKFSPVVLAEAALKRAVTMPIGKMADEEAVKQLIRLREEKSELVERCADLETKLEAVRHAWLAIGEKAATHGDVVVAEKHQCAIM
jgi:AMP deaminase